LFESLKKLRSAWKKGEEKMDGWMERERERRKEERKERRRRDRRRFLK